MVDHLVDPVLLAGEDLSSHPSVGSVDAESGTQRVVESTRHLGWELERGGGLRTVLGFVHDEGVGLDDVDAVGSHVGDMNVVAVGVEGVLDVDSVAHAVIPSEPGRPAWKAAVRSSEPLRRVKSV